MGASISLHYEYDIDLMFGKTQTRHFVPVLYHIQDNGICAITLMSFLLSFSAEVPDDVFAPDFVWKGSSDYKGQKQPMSLTVTSFNATTGKVNVTLTDSSVEFLLSGESSINHLSSASSPLLLSLPPCVTSIYFEGSSCQSVNHRMISCMRVEINYWL